MSHALFVIALNDSLFFRLLFIVLIFFVTFGRFDGKLFIHLTFICYFSWGCKTKCYHITTRTAAAAVTTITHLSIFVYWLTSHKHRVSRVFIHPRIDHLRSCMGSCHFSLPSSSSSLTLLLVENAQCTFHVQRISAFCFRFFFYTFLRHF